MLKKGKDKRKTADCEKIPGVQSGDFKTGKGVGAKTRKTITCLDLTFPSKKIRSMRRHRQRKLSIEYSKAPTHLPNGDKGLKKTEKKDHW